MFKQNRLVNYWKNGKWIADTVVQNKVTTPQQTVTTPKPNIIPATTTKITSIAKPIQAQNAIKQAENAGAFNLDIPTPTPSRLESSVSDMNSTKTGSWQPSYTTGADGQMTSKDPQTIQYMNWVTKQSQMGVDSSKLTPDMFTASGMAENANRSQVGYTESLGIKGSITNEDIKRYGSYELALVAKKKENDLKAQDYVKTQNALASKSEQMQASQENKQAKSAIAGMTSQFAQDRNGTFSAGNALLAPEFATATQNKLEQNSIARQMAQNQRDNAYQQLLDAQASGNDELASSLAKQVSAYDTQIQQTKEEQAKINSAATAAAFDKITKLAAISKDSGGGIFAGWTPQDIATTMNIDLGTASVVANLDARIASMDTSDIDYAQKVANLKKTQQDALWSGMTDDQRNYSFYSSLVKTDPKAAKAYAIKNGFSDDMTAKQIYDSNIEKLKLAQDGYYMGIDPMSGTNNGVFVSPNSLYKCWAGEDGTFNIDVQTGQVPLNGRGQCGEFVNDAIFGQSGFFGDSIDSKKQYINNGMTPVAGGAFIMGGNGDIGHVGIVTKVYEDGSIDIIDSNRGLDETVRTGKIKNPSQSGILGFFNPAKPAGKWNPPQISDNFDDGQKALMDSISLDKYDSKNDRLRLQRMGINEKEFYTYKSENKKILTDTQKTQYDNILEIAQSLYNDTEGLSDAVGPVSSKLPTLEGSTSDFEERFNTLEALIALDNLPMLKGPMSDKDIAFIKSASTALKLRRSEKGFKEELKKLIEGTQKIIGNSSVEDDKKYYNPLEEDTNSINSDY